MPCMSKGLELKVRIFEKNYERKRKAPFIIYADFKNQKVLGANVSRS